MSCQVIQSIMNRSPSFIPGGKWQFLPSVAGVRTLPFADPAVLEELKQEFSLEQLEAARVLVKSSTRLELNPVLAGDGTQGVFLRRAKDDAPFDIINQSGSLSNHAPPSFSCILDYFTKSVCDETKSILVASSSEDLAVLRALQLPCTAAAGLANVNGDQLRCLFADAPVFENCTPRQVPKLPVVIENCCLVLTSWNIAELKNEQPGLVASIVNRMLKAEEAFGLDTSNRLKIWRPSETEFRRICAAAELQDRTSVRNLIRQSMSYSSCSARCVVEETALRNPMNYSAAREELLKTIAQTRKLGLQSSDIAKKLESFNRSFDASVVTAIIQDAMSATDPVERSLLLAAAELMGYWHKSSPIVRVTQEGASGRFHLQEKSLDSEELKEQLRVVDGLVKIHRELTRNK
ncbi:hypothetical protein [Planctomicrobium sp. SH527]|uniref:hypothetical protein n=1 Tax=Planctomicrobium sp. SH527 TaxID=3448123 RepID=UPI003F5C5C72